MTTYNTGNLLGSSAAKDLYDNAQNLDSAVNSITQTLWRDRFGKPRKTWYGIEKLASEAIAAFGYITLDSFQAGASPPNNQLTLPNQVLRDTSNGEYYRWDGALPKAVAAGSTPDSAGGVGAGKWLSVGDATLRTALQGAGVEQGDALIAVKQPFTGSVGQTQHDINKLYVSVTNFGAIPAANATLAVDCTLGLNLALASGASDIYVAPGYYICTETLVVPPGVTLRGSGMGFDKIHPTTILFKGAGAKDYTISGATSTIVNNPDVGAAYLADSGTRGDSYKTTDLSLPFSAAVVLGKRSTLKNIGVVPYFNGLSEYSNPNGGAMSDEWDVGIWLRNASYATVTDCMANGHFRKIGFLASSSDLGDGVIPECELFRVECCSFEGGFGASIRSPLSATGDSNYGFAGSSFTKCLFRGLNHQSQHLATSSFLLSPLSQPSGCAEIDGGVMRGVRFINSTFIHRDDIMIFEGKGTEILYLGCYYESQEIKVNGSVLSDSRGSRMVATSGAVGIQHQQSSSYCIDTTPYFSVRDISIKNSGRYDPAKSGVFNPGTSTFDDWQNELYQTSIGHRLKDASQSWSLYDASNTVVFGVSSSGSVVFNDSLISNTGDLNLSRTVAGVRKPVLRTFSSSGNMQVGDSSGTHTLALDGALIPYADGISNVGMASARFGTYYGVNGAINTSDSTHKTDPRDISDNEINAFSEIARLPSVWKWLVRYQTEGDEARLHSGPTVQAAISIMTKYGLDWSKYGAFCYDKWDEYPAEIDDNGVKQKEAREAGEIYSFRKDELLWWCLRATISLLDSLSERVGKLERK